MIKNRLYRRREEDLKNMMKDGIVLKMHISENITKIT
jgi:hypothetical protein